jgi:porin
MHGRQPGAPQAEVIGTVMQRSHFGVVPLCLLPALIAPAGSVEGGEPVAPVTGAPAAAGPFWLGSATFTGDWGGARTTLAGRGIRIDAFLNDQYQGVWKGGADTNGSGRNSASLDVLITFDLDALEVMADAEALLHLQSNWGSGINPRTGALFEVNDDADGDLGLHVAQLWYRQHFLQRKASLTIGFLDYQTIIDRNAYADSEDKQFMHQTLDNNPLVPLNIGLGAAVTLRPTTWYTMVLGVGDAQSVLYKPGFSTAFHDEDWWFAFMEHAAQVRVDSPRGEMPGNYRIGLIYDPRPRLDFTQGEHEPALRGHDYGLYVSVHQMVYRETAEDEQGLGVFGRFGYRTSETNRLPRFWSGGLQYAGLIPDRDHDVLGFGFSQVEGSSDYRRGVDPDFDRETVYELYYAIQVAKWLVVTPDFQYIDNPGASGEFGHAVVGGVRLRLSL